MHRIRWSHVEFRKEIYVCTSSWKTKKKKWNEKNKVVFSEFFFTARNSNGSSLLLRTLITKKKTNQNKQSSLSMSFELMIDSRHPINFIATFTRQKKHTNLVFLNLCLENRLFLPIFSCYKKPFTLFLAIQRINNKIWWIINFFICFSTLHFILPKKKRKLPNQIVNSYWKYFKKFLCLIWSLLHAMIERVVNSTALCLHYNHNKTERKSIQIICSIFEIHKQN